MYVIVWVFDAKAGSDHEFESAVLYIVREAVGGGGGGGGGRWVVDRSTNRIAK